MLTLLFRPSKGFWGTGETGHLFQGNRGTKAKLLGEQGNRGTKTILGNREHKKIDFWGTGEHANLFQGNKGTGTPPPPPGRASLLAQLSNLMHGIDFTGEWLTQHRPKLTAIIYRAL